MRIILLALIMMVPATSAANPLIDTLKDAMVKNFTCEDIAILHSEIFTETNKAGLEYTRCRLALKKKQLEKDTTDREYRQNELICFVKFDAYSYWQLGHEGVDAAFIEKCGPKKRGELI